MPDEAAKVGNAVAVLLPSIESHEIPAIYQISTDAGHTSSRRVATIFSISAVANMPRGAADHRLIAW